MNMEHTSSRKRVLTYDHIPCRAGGCDVDGPLGVFRVGDGNWGDPRWTAHRQFLTNVATGLRFHPTQAANSVDFVVYEVSRRVCGACRVGGTRFSTSATTGLCECATA